MYDPTDDCVVVPQQVTPQQIMPQQMQPQVVCNNRPSIWRVILGIMLGFLVVSFFTNRSFFTGHAEPQPIPGYGPNTAHPGSAYSARVNAVPGDDRHEALETPSEVRQGEVLKVRLRVDEQNPVPVRAYMAGQAARFFAEEGDKDYLALVPVSVFQKPGAYAIKVEDTGGKIHPFKDVQILDGRYRTQNVNVSAKTAGLQPLPGEMEAIQSLKTLITPIRFWQEPFLSPTSDCQNSPFGVKRYHNGQPTGDYHKGVDLRSPQGQPIHATAAGVVKIAQMFRLHGGTVGIDHGQGITSIYIHMSKVKAHVGDHVLKGDTIGYVGSTGFATGPHLHWGLYVSGLPVNPNPWLDPVPICR